MTHDPLAVFYAALQTYCAGSSDFDLNPDVVLPPDRVLRPAAVLVAYQILAGQPHLVLTKRSLALKHHPGQIAFPGGKRDDADADISITALREAHEEIGLMPKEVEVLGQLPSHETITGFAVTPVLGRITCDFDPKAEQGEVAEVFSVPLWHVLDKQNFMIQSRRWRGKRRHYYTVPYGPYYIWGATACILRRMIG
jgi:8-oxo-dGTP pyrophosphatase MutT (NUDIX family)